MRVRRTMAAAVISVFRHQKERTSAHAQMLRTDFRCSQPMDVTAFQVRDFTGSMSFLGAEGFRA